MATGGRSARLDFGAINRAALEQFESLLREWLPEGRREGREYKALNPTRADARLGSFSISLTKGVWEDFATGDKGSDPVSLYAYLFTDHDQARAARELAERLGLDARPADADAPAPLPAKPKQGSPWRPVLPVPAGASEPPKAHVKRRFPERVWCYRNGTGSVLGYVYRFRTSDGGKEVLPLCWCRHERSGAEAWRWMAFPEPRPLYGLEHLERLPDAPVLVVEGEKCVDAAAAELITFAVVSWPGGGKAVGKADWTPLAGREVVLWPDCDAQRVPLTREEKAEDADPESKPLLPEAEQPGTKTMAHIAEVLLALGCRVTRVAIPAPGEKPGGWDVADAVDEGLRGEALAEFIRANSRVPAPAEPGGGDGSNGSSTPPEAGAGKQKWSRGMIWKARGVLEDCRENVFLTLTQHPAWADCVAYDAFARRVVKRRVSPTGGRPGEWTAEDDFELGLWMAQKLRLVVKGEGTITNGVAMAAARAKFHPVREHLEALPPWDGIERAEWWLEECLGASAERRQYLRIVGRLFLVGMVARVMEPGCKWDYMPILEGPQGKGKSTALRILASEWFADTPLKLGDKDAYMQLDGVWLYEVQEMDAFNRSETTAVKAFVTSHSDHYREPYARRSTDRARQVVFAGTTNQGEYLKDTTGNRRFWPVRCDGPLELDKLAQWREQLLAEALHLYRDGLLWRPSREEEALYIRPEQEAREIVDPWFYKLQDYLDQPEQRFTSEYTSLDLLTQAVGMQVEKIDNNRGAATRIGNLMAKLGWAKGRRTSGRREWVYRRPKETAPAPAGSGAGGLGDDGARR